MTDAPGASDPNEESSEISNDAERKTDSVDTGRSSDGAAGPYSFDKRQFDSIKHSEAPLPTQNPWKKDTLYAQGQKSDRVDSGSVDWPTLETSKQDEGTGQATTSSTNGKIDKRNGEQFTNNYVGFVALLQLKNLQYFWFTFFANACDICYSLVESKHANTESE